jgi:signal transduction histidine kinase
MEPNEPTAASPGRAVADRPRTPQPLASETGPITIRDARPQGAAAPSPTDLQQVTAETAHDFNNLLSVILGCASEIEAGLATEAEVHERAGEIRSAAERGAQLTRQLIDAARPGPPAARTANLNAAIATALPMIERACGPHIDVRCEPDTGLPKVGIPDDQVERILLNLATNGRDAMDGRGTLTIRSSLVPIPPGDPNLGAGWYLRLSVSDEGPGMTSAVMARALEPFYTTKKEDLGSGLGLPTVLGIARDAGGDLRISTSRGVGTTISVYLPGVRDNGESLALPARRRPHSGGPDERPAS